MPCKPKRKAKKYDPFIVSTIGGYAASKTIEELTKRGKKLKVRGRLLDPKKLPKPQDFRGFDGSLIRVVPDIDRLMEVQIRVPSHIFNDIASATRNFPDIEIDRKNRRIVRRGKKNRATNIFIDGE